jgi:hypothetical protein
MPLRTLAGIPSIRRPPLLGGKLLNVPYFHQQQTNWCWATCAEMVFHYYGVNLVRQCDMATAQFGGNCYASPSSSACNQGNWPENTYNHYSFHYTKNNIAFTAAQTQLR